MHYTTQYNQKKITPAAAAALVKDGDWVDYGFGHSFPDLIDHALADRTGELVDVKVRGCLALHPIQIVEKDPDGISFTYNSWHCSGIERKYYDAGRCNFIPMLFRNKPDLYRKHIDVDVAIISVSKMDSHGWFNLSLANAAVKAMTQKAKKVIVEVNEKLPIGLGGSQESIHIRDVDAIVEGEHGPLPALGVATPSETDEKIAMMIAERVRDESVIQLGIGGMPNAVGKMIAKSDLKNLGMHTEMLCDPYLDMYEAGKLTNARKKIDPEKGVWSFCAGSQALYDWVDNNPGLASFSVDYVNDPYVISQHDRIVTVNNCLEVDLYGQACAETSGFRHISGTGGQLDFLTGAFMAKEGQSFICLTSTYYDKKENKLKSRIVPTLPVASIVTDPRSQAFYIATEWGIENLAGKSTWERAESLISLAHPDFREELIASAENMGIWRKTNK